LITRSTDQTERLVDEARRKRERLSKGSCAYCGAAATGVDHVPPRNLFSGNRTNLVTVPACNLHNNQKSGLDERFREFVSLTVGVTDQTTHDLWQPTVRALHRNPRRKASLFEHAFKLPGTDLIGTLYDAEVFHEMLDRITRGLYWHHYRERLPLGLQMEKHRLDPRTELDFLGELNCCRIGGEQFFYAYNRMETHPTVSAWVYLFHQSLLGIVLTGRARSN
jgi:hypothetical protein